MLTAEPGGVEVADDVAVGIEDTDHRDRDIWSAALAAAFSQQILGDEDGGRAVCLGAQQWALGFGHGSGSALEVDVVW